MKMERLEAGPSVGAATEVIETPAGTIYRPAMWVRLGDGSTIHRHWAEAPDFDNLNQADAYAQTRVQELART